MTGNRLVSGAASDRVEPFRAVLLDESDPDDAGTLAELRADPTVLVSDQREAQRADLAGLRGAGGGGTGPGRWAYYPWRRTLVGVLDRTPFVRLRTDRNRNKITAAEQERLSCLRVGVVGLSVGHAVAHTLALEGLCGELRLADFDGIEVSNLNRVPATLLDLGVNKAVVAARRIAELDPYVATAVFTAGVTPENLAEFLDGLDVLVEECDSLDVKVLVREGARARRIPVLMETSDRGLLDVERFDLEPDRPLFHGLLGEVDSASLRALSTQDKVPHVLRILGAEELSTRLAASMVEVGRTLTTWPQLGGDVVLGGATVAAAVRRLGLGRELPSGRVRIDLDTHLDGVTAPPLPPGPAAGDRIPSPRRPGDPGDAEPAGREPLAAVLEAVRRAPSGGNVQPWWVGSDPSGVRLHLDRTRTTAMDVAFRGSYVALGAAWFNARAAAAAAGVLGPATTFPDPSDPDLVAELRFGSGRDERLARVHPHVLERGTNRALGRRGPIPPAAAAVLHDAARAEGGRLHLVDPGARLTTVGETLGAADRVRFLTERLHREMFAEVVWPGTSSEVGIDAHSLGLDAADLAKLTIARRPEVMALLAGWGAGTALVEDTRDRVASSSALAVVTVDGTAPADYVRGGSAVEAVWVGAEEQGLAVHPVSPVFLYAVEATDLATLSPPFAEELGRLRTEFRTAVGLEDEEAVALVLRLSHTATVPSRSARRPVAQFHRTT
jgi:molybdopterin/thiamine biosynthesis adenylyltransferase